MSFDESLKYDFVLRYHSNISTYEYYAFEFVCICLCMDGTR